MFYIINKVKRQSDIKVQNNKELTQRDFIKIQQYIDSHRIPGKKANEEQKK